MIYIAYMKKRSIKQLSEDELVALDNGYRNSDKNYFRERCKCILMSNSGSTVKEIASFFKTRTRTVYAWFDRWESAGIVGLNLKSGQGRKATLDVTSSYQFEIIEKTVANHPQNLAGIAEEVSKLLGFHVSKRVLKGYLKKKI